MISRWPPLIIENDYDEEKNEPAGKIVIVSFPALIKSASYLPIVGKGPTPKTPF